MHAEGRTTAPDCTAHRCTWSRVSCTMPSGLQGKTRVRMCSAGCRAGPRNLISFHVLKSSWTTTCIWQEECQDTIFSCLQVPDPGGHHLGWPIWRLCTEAVSKNPQKPWECLHPAVSLSCDRPSD